MPKLKTHRGAAKRFKRTKGGKFLRGKQGHLVCAVHGATFELVAGDCIAGPCKGAALKAIVVEIHDGAVYVVRT